MSKLKNYIIQRLGIDFNDISLLNLFYLTSLIYVITLPIFALIIYICILLMNIIRNLL